MKRALYALFLLLPGLLHASATFAQTDFGIKGGLNLADIVMTNYINPDVESDLRIKAGVHAGFFAAGMVSERVGMVAELLYSDKGVMAKSNIHLHYISLPLLATYKLTDKLHAEAGPELAYMVSATSDIGNASGTYNNKFDVSLDGGLRLDIRKATVGLRYSAGMFNLREGMNMVTAQGSGRVKYQNRVLQLSLGYRLMTLK